LPSPAQRHRRLHVGGDHALLDQAVRVVARHRIETLDLAVLADARLDLAAAKIERAARIARVLSAPYTAYSSRSEARTGGDKSAEAFSGSRR
jgi:hypothetical protein